MEKAAWACDLELLQRILHLALRHRMATHYPTATSALLCLQCEDRGGSVVVVVVVIVVFMVVVVVIVVVVVMVVVVVVVVVVIVM